MERAPLDVYDDARIYAISHDAAAAIEAAAIGEGSWAAVPELLSKAFPGSWGGLANVNFPESRLNFLSLQNMEPAFVTAYAEHFAYINPWNAFWGTFKGTVIGASEEVCPARNFVMTEFYNDWLLPQDGAIAAAGMKVVGGQGEAVNVLLHYPLARAGTYDGAAQRVLRNIQGTFERAIRLTRLMRNDLETAIAKTALVERSHCAAFVVDGSRHVVEANLLAEELFAGGAGVAVRHGRCYLADADADARFEAVIESLALGRPTSASRIGFRTAGGAWQVSFAALPPAEPMGARRPGLLPPRRLILVQVVALGTAHRAALNLQTLAAVFGLTPAEVTFCQHLLAGATITQAADRSHITLGTARTRLKTIFQKTGTSRQSELMLLLVNAR